MSQRSAHRNEAAASVLALMVTANGRIDPCEMQTLDALQAFDRLGIRRERFLDLARGCLDGVGSTLCECSWLRAPAVAYIDALLRAPHHAPVRDGDHRGGTQRIVRASCAAARQACRLNAASVSAPYPAGSPA